MPSLPHHQSLSLPHFCRMETTRLQFAAMADAARARAFGKTLAPRRRLQIASERLVDPEFRQERLKKPRDNTAQGRAW
jgi:hypothetical protein